MEVRVQTSCLSDYDHIAFYINLNEKNYQHYFLIQMTLIFTACCNYRNLLR